MSLRLEPNFSSEKKNVKTLWSSLTKRCYINLKLSSSLLPSARSKSKWRRLTLDSFYQSRNSPHRAAVVLSFLACVSHATSLGKSCGSQINRKSCFENLWSGAFWDRGPSDPKGVPWDQKFGSKNFLIWSYNDAILCVLLICYAKIWVLCQKQLILLIFPCYGQNSPKWAVFWHKPQIFA